MARSGNSTPGGLLEDLGPFRSAVQAALADLRRNRIPSRIWGHDHTVWKPDPKEITNRLGWLHSPEVMQEAIPEITAFLDGVRSGTFTHGLLLGMGGSSLAPEVFRLVFGVRDGSLDLVTLDTTDPGAVLDLARRLDPRKTLFIVSTKSGGTVETLSLFKYFFNRAAATLGARVAGEHFVAITDPGSSLERIAGELGFRKTFLNPPDIGGRYSALSYFGLVPAGLVGVDVATLLERARIASRASREDDTAFVDPITGVALGAVLGTLADWGCDKLTLLLPPPLAPFGAWIEQLIAESTGKEGKGILPVDGEPVMRPEAYGFDRLFVRIRLAGDGEADAELRPLIRAGHPVVRLDMKDSLDLGSEFFRWEMATAVAANRMGINPFDQPDVESAKVSARAMVETYRTEGKVPSPAPTLEAEGIKVYGGPAASSPGEALKTFLAHARSGGPEKVPRGYVAVQAFVHPVPETRAALEDLRVKIRERTGLAATTGFGPRFLHSTGQLHKGDAGRGLFIQFTSGIAEDADIPDRAGEEGSSISFGVLRTAQALGDRKALLDAGRRVILFHLGEDVAGGLRKLVEAIG